MIRRTATMLLVGLVLPAGFGCGNSNKLNRQAVSGTVTLDGQPVARGAIRFSPQSGSGVSSGGPIADGKYAIRAVDGLPAGSYVVRIYATQQDDGPDPAGAPPGLASQKPAIDLIPARYNSQSELVREVVNDSDNVLDFELVSRGQ